MKIDKNIHNNKYACQALCFAENKQNICRILISITFCNFKTGAYGKPVHFSFHVQSGLFCRSFISLNKIKKKSRYKISELVNLPLIFSLHLGKLYW